VFSGGSEGSDRDLVKRIKTGKLDAAGVATTGLSMVAPELQVLTAPGLLTDDAQLDRVREKLDAKLQKLIEDGGFKLLAWGDGGKNRVFSATEFGAPADLSAKPGWAGKDNAVALAYVTALGTNPVPASAMAAVAFQWYTRLKYVTSTNFNIIVGGSIISKKKFNELSKADQKTLVDTAKRAASRLDQIVGRDDARAYTTLLGRGITEVDTSANQAAWDAAAKKAREQLAQRGVYSKSLLKAVEAAAKAL
ncbi:MAG: TRAP transporter substrate-binding protein DctP, partial [Deltaproteobacteria bacterium]|nr:TRAP transporter substrate-binding protein DctP [Deltaproteobacteria bacterium]